MAGIWHLSHHQFRSETGEILAGAKAYFLAADSNEAITVYADYSLGTELPNPVEANGLGVFPPVFFDQEDSFYRQRITDADGVIISGTDVGILPIISPGGGGGGSEVPVDPNSLWKTGDVKHRLGTGVHAGWVRANARTIGSATSGATERANADAQPLFEHLWQNFSDTLCPVSGGRGATSAEDWAANKTIQLPDFRGISLAGLDDMGNSAAGRLTAASFAAAGNSPTTLGAKGGAEQTTLSEAQLPVINFSATASQGTHHHDILGELDSGTAGQYVSGNSSGNMNGGHKTQDASAGPITVSITPPSIGGGAAHPNVQPTALVTLYIRL